MIAGVLVSAVIGGLAGLGVALSQNFSGVQMLLFYQLGGMTAILAFLALAGLTSPLAFCPS